jgi:PAS domain S-box-containing protein
MTGLFVVVGWIAGIEPIKRVAPGLVAMNPASAVSFVLAGVSLSLLSLPDFSPRLRRLGQVCAGLVLLVGLLKLVACFGGPDLHVDQWLFRAQLDGADATPNRMAPNTSLNFALIAMALLCLSLRTEGGRFLARLTAFSCGLFSLLAVLGYVNGVTTLYRFASFIPMALHTALSFLVLSAGVVFCHPVESARASSDVAAAAAAAAAEAARVRMGNGGSMTGSLQGKVTLGFGAAVFMLCVLGIVSYKSINHLLSSSGWDDHTRVVLATIAEVSSDIVTVESAARGYVITGDQRHVQRYRQAVDAVHPAVQQLRRLTSDNPRQQQRLDQLDALLTAKLQVMQRSIDLGGTDDDAAVRHVSGGKGLALMDQLRGVLAEMKREEDGLLQERSAEKHASARRTITVISFGSVLAFTLVALAGWMIRRDIAARRQAETALRESEERYRFLADAMPQIIWSGRPDGRVDYYNVRWHEFTGLTLEQSGSDGWAPALHPDDRQVCVDRWSRSLRSGEPFEGEYRFRRGSDAAYRWHLCRGLARRDARGETLQWVGTFTDIDDHKRIEEALRAAEQRLRLLVEGVKDYAILMLDQDGCVASWNAGAERIKGYKAEEILGQHFSRFYRPEDVTQGKPARELTVAADEGRYEEEGWRVRKDGTRFWANVVITAVRDEHGTLRGFAKVTRDVTERKRAEDAIRKLNAALQEHAAQLGAANKELESFCYSVSHDLRAPLRSVDGFSQALLEDFADKLGEEGRDSLQRVRAATQRMAQLIDDMLNLSRVTRSEMRREPLDLTAAARAVVAELQKAEPQRHVHVAVAEGVTAQGDARLLRIVLDNLIGNAWKFSGRTDQARIEFGKTSDGSSFYVRDNGAGFDMAYAHKLFGAFQRLHAMNEYAGTGIGLATVQRIIHRHGGRVWAEGAVGKGATFFFTLPAGAANLPAAA